MIEDYYNTYKGVRRYMEEIPVQAREHGYVRSIYGRIRPLPGITDRNANIRQRRRTRSHQHADSRHGQRHRKDGDASRR